MHWRGAGMNLNMKPSEFFKTLSKLVKIICTLPLDKGFAPQFSPDLGQTIHTHLLINYNAVCHQENNVCRGGAFLWTFLPPKNRNGCLCHGCSRALAAIFWNFAASGICSVDRCHSVMCFVLGHCCIPQVCLRGTLSSFLSLLIKHPSVPTVFRRFLWKKSRRFITIQPRRDWEHGRK